MVARPRGRAVRDDQPVEERAEAERPFAASAADRAHVSEHGIAYPSRGKIIGERGRRAAADALRFTLVGAAAAFGAGGLRRREAAMRAVDLLHARVAIAYEA